MEDKILKLLGRRDYVPANVPELLRGLHLAANQQQKLQKELCVCLSGQGGWQELRGTATSCLPKLT
jgi:hypothetical protein